eukprot:gnl/Hemi2/22789_TR7630_c0_g1_i1.p1 gnl/Hemi2/22789_TR7630_c0_g1~~gnl/Hemi2/22789_TR7630_c0_g1_i1.p1  ORF type:complete len:240 (-),score=59.36 gnl/Hemi2/22789_TR7630_c0_g1_i1:139-807(-)
MADAVMDSLVHSLKAPGEVGLGTSIMAVQFDGGVVVGADSRTSTGSYIANRVSDKLTQVSDYIYCCRSGSAADTQAVSDYVRYFLQQHSIELGAQPDVKTAARLFQHFCYDYKDQLMAGIICAGWDKHNGGQVYNIPLGGCMVRQPFATGGSGSTYIYGYTDATFKPNMTRQECEQFVINSLSLAMSRDGSSGGVIRLVTIDQDGLTRRMVEGNKLPTFFTD